MPKKKLDIEEDELPFVPEVEVTGVYPTLVRKRTGLFSLDFALSSQGYLGLPLRTIVELSGREGVGKSTLAYYIAGKVSDPKSLISVCDIELLDTKYVKSATGIAGFKGTVHLIDGVDDKGNMRHHEKMLWDMVKELSDNKTGASVLDSISALQPVVEQEVLNEKNGEFGQAFMGKRAKMVGQVARALSGVLRNRESPSVALIVNHVYPNLGSPGFSTAGGVVKDAEKAVSLRLWVGEYFGDDNNRPIGFLVKGHVDKLRFGGKGGEFQFYIVPGLGVHPGVSAMFDCFDLGLAERSARVKLHDRSLGFLKADLLTYAAQGKTRKFLPFLEEVDKHAEKVKRGEV